MLPMNRDHENFTCGMFSLMLTTDHTTGLLTMIGLHKKYLGLNMKYMWFYQLPPLEEVTSVFGLYSKVTSSHT